MKPVSVVVTDNSSEIILKFTPGEVLFWDFLKEKVDEMRDCIIHIQNNIDAAIQINYA